MDYVSDRQGISVKILRSILRSERIAHAYLLKGPRGSGKEELAREFAKALLCVGCQDTFLGQDRLEGPEDFALSQKDICRSCASFDKGQHPDFYLIQKDGSTIKIKASHSMIKEALTKPFLSKRKVFVIHEAENLTAEAANALLKLLEEPPPYMVFILTAVNENLIPSTVISRCQVIPLRPPAKHGAENTEWQELLCEGQAVLEKVKDGSPSDLALDFSKESPEEKQRLAASLEAALGKNLHDAVNNNRPIEQSLEGLKSLMNHRQRLNANTNAFLSFFVLFMDIKGFFTPQT